MRKAVVLCLLAAFLSLPSHAQELSGGRKAVKYSGDALLFAMPVATLAAVVVQKDWTGLKQAAFSTVSTLGATYLLKYTVRKERPDHSDFHSFPSAHTSILFANAAFVQRRYGWKWGLPAYVLATHGLEPHVRAEARLVGRGGRRGDWRGVFVHIYPPVRAEA